MSLCKYYELYDRYTFTYNPLTGAPIPHRTQVGVCLGTKEQDECSCEGNRCNCDFYAHVRETAKLLESKKNIPTRIADIIVKLNEVDLSGYIDDEAKRADIIVELLDIKSILEREGKNE